MAKALTESICLGLDVVSMGSVDCRNELFGALLLGLCENLVRSSGFDDIARLEKDDIFCNLGCKP